MTSAATTVDLVDSATAHELLKEATKLASTDELEAIGRLLERKAEAFGEVLGDEARLSSSDPEALRRIVELVFSVRSRRKMIFGAGADGFRESLAALLYGDEPIAERFDVFIERYQALGARRAYALASELLHFTEPQKYWLWTHWIWDPQTGNGALKLLTEPGVDLGTDLGGRTYLKVGRATAAVASDGFAEGYTQLGRGLFGTDVFLASAAAIAMFTQYKLRISQEFLRFIPELPDLARRLLGVQSLGEN